MARQQRAFLAFSALALPTLATPGRLRQEAAERQKLPCTVIRALQASEALAVSAAV